MIRRFPKAHAAHRLGHGRASLRLRRPAQSLPGVFLAPAPIGHNSMPEGESEPEWLKERPMSDNWNNQHQEYHQPQDQHQGDFQGNFVQEPQIQTEPVDTHQPHDQHQDWQQPVETIVPPHVDPHAERIAALEATIAELKSTVDALHAGHAASTVHEPVAEGAIVHGTEGEIHHHAEGAVDHLVEADVVDAEAHAVDATAESHVAEASAADAHGDRLAAIEQELSHLRTLVGAVAHSVSEIGTDVKAHADLHAETRAVVDEQHQLLRGLNYIITSAIGTLTTAARQPK